MISLSNRCMTETVGNSVRARIKSLFKLAIRQVMEMAQSLLKLAGLDRQLANFSIGRGR